MHRFALHNDVIRDASEKFLSPGQVGLLNGWGVFSTIRVQDGVLFAWERHWERMKHDADLMRVPFPGDADNVRRHLLELVLANGAQWSTLRIAIVRNRGGMWEGAGIDHEFDLIAFTADLKDWGPGARLSVAPEARHSSCMFAGAKILSWSMNLAFLETAQNEGFDEVILLNERGEVSECTSANIFISEGTQVWTPPLSSGCLPGVTRGLLLTEIRVPGIKVGERDLRLKDLEDADEVFITSTTRDLLPVLSVSGINVRCGEGPRALLAQAFAEYVNDYVRSWKQTVHPSKEL